MRIIKLGLISFIAFALVLTVISLFFPSHVRVSKAIDITADKYRVIGAISNPHEWRYWYPGADTLELWKENGVAKGLLMNNGNGKIMIIEKTDSTVSAVTSGGGLRKMNTGWNFFPSGLPNTFTIQWYMDFKLNWYPWDKFSSILLEKRYGPTMELGLEKLKQLLENPGRDSLLNGN